MKSVNTIDSEDSLVRIERIRELLFKLMETQAHELPEEALQSKDIIKDYFLENGVE